jgi:hypothetical protein
MNEPEHEEEAPLDDEHYPEDVPEDDPLYWRAMNPARKPEPEKGDEGDHED